VSGSSTSRDTLSGATLPSGSSAGVATESWVANTPGPGSGCGRPDRTRSRDSARWPRFSPGSRSTCVSTIAPTAAVMSSAEVSSNANRYLVNSSSATLLTLPLPAFWVASPAIGVLRTAR
jgi:hypothetical protein